MRDQTFINNADIHDEQENEGSNCSGNKPFIDVLTAATSRRTIMQGGLTAAAAGFLAPAMVGSAEAHGYGRGRGRGRDLIDFRSISLEEAAANPAEPTISADYEYQVIIPWGTPIEPGATRTFDGDPNNRPTAAEAEKQVGIGHDGMWFFPLNDNPYGDDDDDRPYRFGRGRFSNRAGMLCVNHEFGNTNTVLGKPVPESIEDVRIMQAVHGVSVVKIAKDHRGRWETEKSPNARRITVNTPVDFSGPAAGSPLLENENGNIALGTVNNCGSGPTPWGTYLTCEENFNGYFGATDSSWEPTEEQARLGFTSSGFGYAWYLFDGRFDLSDPEYANESNRFGWIVEIDPMDGTQKPVKRTALGRFKHEAVAIAEGRGGRVAAYMGDDERFDYCYRYVSDDNWRYALSRGESPLDKGTLYVARFDEDGTGEWLPLNLRDPRLAARFSGMDELLINTRIAADIVGATPMDRPEWTTIGKDGEVYWTLTNNSRRTEANAANPETPNIFGHIIRTKDSQDHTGTSFRWEIFVLASESAGTEGAFGSPDAAYADPDGRLFIGTDGGQPAEGLNNQLVVFDTTEGDPVAQRLFVGVTDDEITGWTNTPDFRTAFINSQHPGNGDPSATNFPEPRNGVTIPRDATIVITRKNGGVIGS